MGRAQSALLRQAGVFQRELNKIDQHRVHLGRTGLSSSDLVAWLRSLRSDALAQHADEAHLLPLHPPFLQDQIALDVAEYELLERERAAAESTELPGAEATPTTHDLPIDEEDLSPLLDWHGELASVTSPLELTEALRGDDYALSAYRLSLLGLLGDPESSALQGPTADLARLPLQLEIEPRLVDPGLAAIAQIFRHMFVALEDPRFEIRDVLVQDDQCFLTWDFVFRMRRFRRDEQRVHGSSHLRFAPDGRIAAHRDYWDAAEELYEKLPLLGGLMRWLKRRANS